MPSGDLQIDRVIAWEALDSRGVPTVACTVRLECGAVGRVIVPSGKSTGRYEAAELRDGGDRFGGQGARRAVTTVNTILAPRVIGMDASRTFDVDAVLMASPPLTGAQAIGSNATIAVSVAALLAAAAAKAQPVWRMLDPSGAAALPMPMIQIVGGGAHAGEAIDLQDVLAIPIAAESFAQAIEWVARVRAAALSMAEGRGPIAHLVADEGGLALPFESNRAAVEFVAEAIERAGLAGRTAIAIDVAGNQLEAADGRVRLNSEHRTVEVDAWLEELASWTRSLPIVSIEDPLPDDHWAAWRTATEKLHGIQLIGDDLFATDASRLERGVAECVANAVLVKVNQRGTVSEAADVIRTAAEADYATIVSARSGDTEDTWLADLAVGWRSGQIKVGALTRSERTAKWNRLLEIEVMEPNARLTKPFLAQ